MVTAVLFYGAGFFASLALCIWQLLELMEPVVPPGSSPERAARIQEMRIRQQFQIAYEGGLEPYRRKRWALFWVGVVLASVFLAAIWWRLVSES